MVGGSNPLTPTSEETDLVNDLVNKLLALVYSQDRPRKPTEFMLGGLQIGTAKASQKWVDEFLFSRRQGLAQSTLKYYRDILNQFIGTDLTPRGINAWLTSLDVGNAKLNYYQVVKIFCTWLHRSRKINRNPADLVDRPKIRKLILPAITEEQLDTLLGAAETSRDRCILNRHRNKQISISRLG